MHKFRSIRAAVSLCLIGALLLPSAAWRLTAAACGASVAGAATCDGCGHCRTKADGGHCGCCEKRIALAAKLGQACCHTAGNAAIDEDESPDTTWGECLCRRGSVPALPAPPSRTTAEQLAQLHFSMPAVAFVAAADEALLLLLEPGSAPPALLPRDAQRRLCVWLI